MRNSICCMHGGKIPDKYLLKDITKSLFYAVGIHKIAFCFEESLR